MGWVVGQTSEVFTLAEYDETAAIEKIEIDKDGTIKIYFRDHPDAQSIIDRLNTLTFPLLKNSQFNGSFEGNVSSTTTATRILTASPLNTMEILFDISDIVAAYYVELPFILDYKEDLLGFMRDAAREMKRTGTLGILGGGQLGRMLALEAAKLGIKVKVLDPLGAAAPAAVAAQAVTGDFRDKATVMRFAESVDILTAEIEHVNAAALYELEVDGITCVQPTARTIGLIQDKHDQKQHFEFNGLPVGEFREIPFAINSGAPDRAVLLKIVEEYGYPFILKSKRQAYDGRGNRVVNNPDELDAAVAELGLANGLYAEKFQHFDKELAVMVVRSLNGEIKTYPVTETIQKNNICYVTETPAQIPDEARVAAEDLAKAAVESLDGAGVFGVEMFLMKDVEVTADVPPRKRISWRVLLNEVAPRVHNSGHYTLDACHVSQFENHVRAVLGMPLGDTSPRENTHAIMFNMLGQADGAEGKRLASELFNRALATPGCNPHWYAKDGVRQGRKIGHFNFVGRSVAEVRANLGLLDAEAVASLKSKPKPVVAIIMGSDSDLKTMSAAAEEIERFGVPVQVSIVSAHRTPERLARFAQEAYVRGIRVIVAGAGGAAHLPGMVAANSPIPVIGVPVIPTSATNDDGTPALHSMVFMPGGVPVATVAIGNAKNGGLLALEILATSDQRLFQRLLAFKATMKAEVEAKAAKLEDIGWKPYRAEMEQPPAKKPADITPLRVANAAAAPSLLDLAPLISAANAVLSISDSAENRAQGFTSIEPKI